MLRPTLRLLHQQQRGQAPFKLTMYTGTDCQLCDVMRDQITRAAQTLPIELHTYNIRDDSLPDVHTWRRKYQYDIPVLHLNDTEIFRHRVTAEQLVQRLRESQSQSN